MIGIAPDHTCDVKRWRNGQMALRWCAAGLIQARAQFPRVNGHLHLRALEQHAEAENVGHPGNNETVIAA